MITKDSILKVISQEDIIRKYFPYNISLNNKYTNPFRHDKNPRCEFQYSKSGVLYFVDWAKRKRYDCFNIASEVTNINNFQLLLKKINDDFNLDLMPKSLLVKEKKEMNITNEQYKREFEFVKVKNNKETKYSYKIKDYNQKELNFWLERKINKSLLYNIYSLDFLQVNDYLYESNEYFKMFLYDFGKEGFQVYLPDSEEVRFITNIKDPSYLMGFDNLNHFGKDIIITSSFKDVKTYEVLNINSCAQQTESNIISEYYIKNLSKRFDNIWINFNNDEIGIEWVDKNIEHYKKLGYILKPLILEKEKDPSDVVKKYGLFELTEQLEKYGIKSL